MFDTNLGLQYGQHESKLGKRSVFLAVTKALVADKTHTETLRSHSLRTILRWQWVHLHTTQKWRASHQALRGATTQNCDESCLLLWVETFYKNTLPTLSRRAGRGAGETKTPIQKYLTSRSRSPSTGPLEALGKILKTLGKILKVHFSQGQIFPRCQNKGNSPQV